MRRFYRKIDIADSASDDITGEQLLEVVKLSYSQEIDRYESLTADSGRLLTAISIGITAAVFLVRLFQDVKSAACFNTSIFTACIVIVFALLVSSFVLALLSSIRFKYKQMNSPANLAAVWKNDYEKFSSKTEAIIHFADSLEESYVSYRERNEKIRKLLTASMVCLLIAVVIAFFGSVLFVLL